MATILIRAEKTKTHRISIEQENTLLIVSACPIINECLVGYPQDKITYNYKDMKNAQATFRRYLKKYL